MAKDGIGVGSAKYVQSFKVVGSFPASGLHITRVSGVPSSRESRVLLEANEQSPLDFYGSASSASSSPFPTSHSPFGHQQDHLAKMADTSDIPQALRDQLYDTPGFAPPNGTTSNFDNPPNSNASIAAVIFCLVVASLAAILRFISRAFIHKRVEIQDGRRFICVDPVREASPVELDLLKMHSPRNHQLCTLFVWEISTRCCALLTSRRAFI